MYDVIVIGCGPGGYAAAIRASQLGGKVAVVEAGEVGGTCVNRGCIPSKVWLKAAGILNTIQRSEEFGIKVSSPKIDIKAILERKNTVASEIRMGMEALLQNNKVELIRGHAELKNAREIKIDGKAIESKNTILATGSSLDIPDNPDLQDALLTSDDLLDMTSLPSSVLVWGEAGTLEVEMAALLNALGSKVTLVTPSARILPMEDHDTSQRLAQAFREQGIQVLTRSNLETVKKSKKRFEAMISGRKEQALDVEKVLIAGRKPNLDNLGLQQAGVPQNEDGSVQVDEKLQTSVKGIFAIGDITGGWMNSHAASSMGVTAAENAMGQANGFPFHLIPRVLWTTPQVGAVGLTEEEAEKKGFDVDIGDFPYPINGLAMCYGEVDGSVKVVSDAATEEILGIHIVGANATELVGEAVMALQLECTTDELAHTIRPHPTFSEGIMDAGRDSASWALYLPRK
jgi:dihydrolipoamide dehydrogenase